MDTAVYYLVLMSFTLPPMEHGVDKGGVASSVQFIEFSSQVSCDAARKRLVGMRPVPGTQTRFQISAECMPK